MAKRATFGTGLVNREMDEDHEGTRIEEREERESAFPQVISPGNEFAIVIQEYVPF